MSGQTTYAKPYQISEVSPVFSEFVRKNYWVRLNAKTVIISIVRNLPNRNVGNLDYYNFCIALLQQTFVKEKLLGKSVTGANVYIYIFNKKRTKRFIKQNLNRFLKQSKK